MDIVCPLVFPDYKIGIETPQYEVDLFPFTNIDNFSIPAYKKRVSNLVHAGILFINGHTGTTKYYEYGRYDPPHNLGLVRRIPIPDVLCKEGEIEVQTLKLAMRAISRLAGQQGRIQGLYIEVVNKYEPLLKYAEFRKLQNSNPKRKPYDILTNSCIHFVKEMTEVAGIKNPWMIDPRPNSYIGEFDEAFPDLEYKKDVLAIEDKGTF